MISIIIPAYQEAIRLPPVLEQMRAYLDRTTSEVGGYEIIVVDDGSTDKLPEILAQIARDWNEMNWVSHSRNNGKGAALRTGLQLASGELMLISDADGAVSIEEELLLRQALETRYDAAIGSRLLGGSQAWRSAYRGLLGRAFAHVTQLLYRLPVRDTQCGFKMFRREVVEAILPRCHETGYLFDLELLIRAHQSGFQMVEVPIQWYEVPGSKVRPIRDGWKMLTGLSRLSRSCKQSVHVLDDG